MRKHLPPSDVFIHPLLWENGKLLFPLFPELGLGVELSGGRTEPRPRGIRERAGRKMLVRKYLSS
jgi:hypothetical protein